jgi:hypothetical protein
MERRPWSWSDPRIPRRRIPRIVLAGSPLYHNKRVLVRGVISSFVPLGLGILSRWPPWIGLGITLCAFTLVGTVLQFFWKPRSDEEQRGTNK